MMALYLIAITLFIILCLLLCFVILIQESKSSGLGVALGGGDASDSVFGTSTADVLKKFTAYLAAIFMISCLLLTVWTQSLGRSKMESFSDLEIEESIPIGE